MLVHYFLLLVAFIAGTTAISATEVLAQLPLCSLPCVLSGFGSSACGLSDLACSCTNNTLQSQLSTCIQGACNFTAVQQVSFLNAQICVGVPIEDKSWDVIVAGAVLVPIALLCVAMRCYSRYTIVKTLWWDDYTIILAAILLAGLLIAEIINAFNGFGRHVWNIDQTHVPTLLKVFWAAEIIYVVVLTITKISILLFYLKVFPGQPFRISAMITLASVTAAGIAFTLAIVFQCTPIGGAFDRNIPSTCINLNAAAFSSSGISIAQDLVILFLPLPQLQLLNMSLKKRLNLMFMFSLGSLACIISIVRLKYLVDFGSTMDPTYDNITPAIWSLAEICVAMICACLPAMRALLSRWVPFLFDIGSSNRSGMPSRPTLVSRTSTFNAKSGSSWIKRTTADVELDPEDIMMETFDNKSAIRKTGIKKLVLGKGGKVIEIDVDDGIEDSSSGVQILLSPTGIDNIDDKRIGQGHNPLNSLRHGRQKSDAPTTNSFNTDHSNRAVPNEEKVVFGSRHDIPRLRDDSPVGSEFSDILRMEGPRESDEVEMISSSNRSPTLPSKNSRDYSHNSRIQFMAKPTLTLWKSSNSLRSNSGSISVGLGSPTGAGTRTGTGTGTGDGRL